MIRRAFTSELPAFGFVGSASPVDGLTRRIAPSSDVGFDEIPWGRVDFLTFEGESQAFEHLGAFLGAAFNLTVTDRGRLESQFTFATRLSSSVPVRRLTYPRRLAALPEVCDALLADLGESASASAMNT